MWDKECYFYFKHGGINKKGKKGYPMNAVHRLSVVLLTTANRQTDTKNASLFIANEMTSNFLASQ